MARILEWRERLQVVLHDAETRKFNPGTYDCFSGLTSACVEAIIGEDIAAPYRGQYSTMLGAVRLIKEQGYNDLLDAIAQRFTEVPTAFANHGDIVAIPDDTGGTGYALGICLGERIAVMHPDGYGTIDRFEAIRAFRVE